MKKLFFIIILSLSFAIFDVYGDNGTTKKEVPIDPIPSQPTTRPNAPSNQSILCSYGDGCMYFSFRYPEGICLMEVTELSTGESGEYTFDSSSEAVVYVGELTNARIIITTANGHSYEGYLQ